MKQNIIMAMLVAVALTFDSSPLAFSQTKDKMGKKSEQQSKAATGSKAEEEVMQVMNERRAAVLQGDVEVYARQTADDYLGIGTNGGRARNKEEVLAGMKSSDSKWISINDSDLKVRVYGNTAVVTYLSTTKAMTQGQEVSRQTRFTQVLVKQQGRWRFVSMQQTSVAPPKAQ